MIILLFIFPAHKYHSRADFISDIALIATNCEQYNGADSDLTKDARVLVDFTRKALDEVKSSICVWFYSQMIVKYSCILTHFFVFVSHL